MTRQRREKRQLQDPDQTESPNDPPQPPRERRAKDDVVRGGPQLYAAVASTASLTEALLQGRNDISEAPLQAICKHEQLS